MGLNKFVLPFVATLTACDGIPFNTDTGVDIQDFTSQECFEGMQTTSDATNLALTAAGDDDNEVWFFMSSLDDAVSPSEVRCFIVDENDIMTEANYSGGEWTTQASDEMWLTCSSDCEEQEQIANCIDGLSCDMPGNESGEAWYPLHESIY